AALRDAHVELLRALLEQRARQLDALRHDVRHLDWAPLQLDLAARDARYVEQVVDQVHEVPHLALDDRTLSTSAHAVAHLHELECRQDRCERVSELVAEERQKFLFPTFGRVSLFARNPEFFVAVAKRSLEFLHLLVEAAKLQSVVRAAIGARDAIGVSGHRAGYHTLRPAPRFLGLWLLL